MQLRWAEKPELRLWVAKRAGHRWDRWAGTAASRSPGSSQGRSREEGEEEGSASCNTGGADTCADSGAAEGPQSTTPADAETCTRSHSDTPESTCTECCARPRRVACPGRLRQTGQAASGTDTAGTGPLGRVEASSNAASGQTHRRDTPAPVGAAPASLDPSYSSRACLGSRPRQQRPTP